MSELTKKYTGEWVIVRSRSEGVNFGRVVDSDETGIILSNCRRLWEHLPKDISLSWYEGVAVSGLAADQRISGAVKEKAIIENYSITLCSEECVKIIRGYKANAQS